jgi:eukaryotic-like serine/threonine-protein kinase
MQLPARIGKYELVEFLGGGMSQVFRARDTVLGREVAVKVLTEEGCKDADAKARFLAEARMSGAIVHDHIIRIHDYGEEDGRPYIVMEFLVGEDLRGAIRNNRTGDLRNRVRIALEVARALGHVHSHKIIHRDIKPENIHVDTQGRVRLMDFGIAKSHDLHLTRTGFAVGTPYYMAPEQVLGKAVTEQVDVYAFGLVFYELLTGLKPLSGDSVERLFFMILTEPLDLEPLRQSGAPASIVDLVTRCAAKKPEERPAGFGAVVAELERIQAELAGERIPAPAPPAPAAEPPPAATPAPPPPAATPIARYVLGGLAAALLVFAGIVAVKYLGGGREQKQSARTEIAEPKPAAKALPPMIETPAGPMALVPEGAFLSGANRESTTLPAFYIDVTEVSNAAYQQFATATGHALPVNFAAAKPGDPVVDVSFDDARDFATWAGKRLPTAREWEKAARGTDGRVYPWGDEPDTARANVADNPSRKGKGLLPVNSMLDSASPYKVLHLTGNVWEWVNDRQTPSILAIESFSRVLKPPPTADEPWAVIRGGSHARPLKEGVTYEFASAPARFTSPEIGFRCAKDP